jgi:hypothetical protein
MSVSYGSYVFPSPLPFVAMDDTPVYVAGQADHFVNKFNLIGTFTGLNLSGLNLQKKNLVSGLLSEYQTLTINEEVYAYAKPINATFSESDLTTVLPYSVEFEVYEEKFFSDYFGIKNPQNIWTYTEQQGRIVQASHVVSAVGVKVNAQDPLLNARNFVNSKLTGFENLSIFHSGNSGFFRSKIEEVDRFNNSYGATENYIFSTSLQPIITGAILSANTQIAYSKEGNLQLNVAGSIVGNLTGAIVTTGMFSPTQATNLALNAVEQSRSSYESGIYGFVNKGPATFNYDVDEAANTINFSFQFKDPTDLRSNEVIDNYTVFVSASKDSNNLQVSVNGNLTYNGAFDIFTGGSIVSGARFAKLEAALTGINPYKIALEHYSDFLDVAPQYENVKYLSPLPIAESIKKNPFEPSIAYSYEYNNAIDYTSGLLRNYTFDITDEKPLTKVNVKQSVIGFATQTVVNRSLGQMSIRSSCAEPATGLPIIRNITSGLLGNKNCQISSEEYTTGDSTIDYSISALY